MITQDYMEFARQTVKDMDAPTGMTVDLVEWSGNTNSIVNIMFCDWQMEVKSDEELDELLEALKVVTSKDWM